MLPGGLPFCPSWKLRCGYCGAVGAVKLAYLLAERNPSEWRAPVRWARNAHVRRRLGCLCAPCQLASRAGSADVGPLLPVPPCACPSSSVGPILRVSFGQSACCLSTAAGGWLSRQQDHADNIATQQCVPTPAWLKTGLPGQGRTSWRCFLREEWIPSRIILSSPRGWRAMGEKKIRLALASPTPMLLRDPPRSGHGPDRIASRPSIDIRKDGSYDGAPSMPFSRTFALQAYKRQGDSLATRAGNSRHREPRWVKRRRGAPPRPAHAGKTCCPILDPARGLRGAAGPALAKKCDDRRQRPHAGTLGRHNSSRVNAGRLHSQRQTPGLLFVGPPIPLPRRRGAGGIGVVYKAEHTCSCAGWGPSVRPTP